MQPAHQGLQLTVETVQIAGESPQFIRIDICLSHNTSCEPYLSRLCGVYSSNSKGFVRSRNYVGSRL